MRDVLILGTKKTIRPAINYLSDHNRSYTIATVDENNPENLVNSTAKGSTVIWNPDDSEGLNQMITGHRLILSFLPERQQVEVARFCLHHQKNLVAASSLSREVKRLDEEARGKNILLLNEAGFKPGLNHMTAMQLIDKVHEWGGRVKEFYTFCGALPAPEETGNPFGFKFSLPPRTVLKSANHKAILLKDKKNLEIQSHNLYKDPVQVIFPGIGQMEAYPAGNALILSSLYGLHETETLFQGILRYPHWCQSMNVIKMLGLVSHDPQNFEGKSYKEVVADKLGVFPRNVKEKVTEKLRIGLDDPAITALEWLGFFDSELITIKHGSNLDLTVHLMERKMMLPPGARDMTVLFHSLVAAKQDGKKEIIQASLSDFGTRENTSLDQMNALPAAIAARFILEGQIKSTGVQIPVLKMIYEPILKELEKMGITMTEKWGLPESEKII